MSSQTPAVHCAAALALAFAATLPIAASAEPLAYRYVDGGLSADSDDGLGFALRGSYGFGDDGDSGLYLMGSYVRRSGDDDFGRSVTRTDLDVGVGYRHVLDDHWDLIGEVAASRVERPLAAADAGTGAARVGVGTRVGFSERVEGLLRVDYRSKCPNGDACFGGAAGLQVMLSTSMSINTEVQFGDAGEVLTIALRARF